MRMTRLYLPEQLVVGQQVALSSASSEYLLRVLRLQPGAVLTLFNGDGFNYCATLVSAKKREAIVEPTQKLPGIVLGELRVHLAQCLARGEKMDWIIQKCTELGVNEFTPIESEHTEVRLKGDRVEKRQQHWFGVMVSACEQCGRSELPQLHPIISLPDFCVQVANQNMCKLILDPDANDSLSSIDIASEVLLLIGPEGGFSERDLTAAKLAGFKPVRIGPRVLRTETVGTAVLAALQVLKGDWN